MEIDRGCLVHDDGARSLPVVSRQRALVRLGRWTTGDKIVIVAGSPPGSPGKTNALRVHRIGDAIELPYP